MLRTLRDWLNIYYAEALIAYFERYDFSDSRRVLNRLTLGTRVNSHQIAIQNAAGI
jgi:hypothetical protein